MTQLTLCWISVIATMKRGDRTPSCYRSIFKAFSYTSYDIASDILQIFLTPSTTLLFSTDQTLFTLSIAFLISTLMQNNGLCYIHETSAAEKLYPCLVDLPFLKLYCSSIVDLILIAVWFSVPQSFYEWIISYILPSWDVKVIPLWLGHFFLSPFLKSGMITPCFQIFWKSLCIQCVAWSSSFTVYFIKTSWFSCVMCFHSYSI